MYHPDIIGADARMLGASTVSEPTPQTKRRTEFAPEKAVFKAHRALAVLDGLPDGEALDVRSISERSGLTTRDLGRIMNRLTAAARVSRTKDDSKPNGYFRYWVNEEQRKRFRAEFRASKVVSNMRVPTQGDAKLDEMAAMHARLLTSKQDIEREKARLAEQIAAVRAQLEVGLSELDEAKAYLARERSQLREIERDIKRQRESVGKAKYNQSQALSRLGEEVVKQEARVTAKPFFAGHMDPIELSATLSFVQQLRRRPALADMAQLAKIEADYQSALRAARGE